MKGKAARSSGFSREFSLPRPMRVESWAAADSALAELGKLERQQEALAARRAAEIEAAARRWERAAARLEARQRHLATALEKFCREQAVAFTDRNGHRSTALTTNGRRSRSLLFGRLGFRRVHWLRVRNEARAIAALARSRSGRRFIRVESALDRDTLHQFLLQATNNGQVSFVQRLQRAGIRLHTHDAWFYKTNPEAVVRWG